MKTFIKTVKFNNTVRLARQLAARQTWQQAESARMNFISKHTHKKYNRVITVSHLLMTSRVKEQLAESPTRA